jgi:hypothetical protein
VWDEKSLDKWLTDPDAFLPGNDMDFLVSKASGTSGLDQLPEADFGQIVWSAVTCRSEINVNK